MAPPAALLLASLAPLLLEFDPEQWKAWQQFSSGLRNKNPEYKNLLTRLVRAYHADSSEKSTSRVPVSASSGSNSGHTLLEPLTSSFYNELLHFWYQAPMLQDALVKH